jgi:hypothetical protein
MTTAQFPDFFDHSVQRSTLLSRCLMVERKKKTPVDFRVSSTLNIRMKNGKVDE